MSTTPEPPVPRRAAHDRADGFDLIVPVKRLLRAKTRLHGHSRPALVRAFALDAIGAALRAEHVRAVHLLSDDPGLAEDVARLGVGTLPDRGDGDLNVALVEAARMLRGTRGPTPVAAMLGDLPCLLAEDLDDALAQATLLGGGFVPDADGTGTTLLAAHGVLEPHFGAGSRAAHADAGVPEVGLGAATLRRDVDTADDLDAARALGLGPRSAALVTPR